MTAADALFDEALAPTAAAKARFTDAPDRSGDEPTAARAVVPRAAVGAPSRWDSPATSYAAGASVHAAESEHYVLGLVARLGVATDEQIEAAARAEGARWQPQRLRTARARWVQRGRVVLVDRDGTTSTGRRAQRWALADYVKESA